MNPSADRVAVPTNGHRPALSDDALDASPADDTADAPDAPAPDAADAPDGRAAAVPSVSPGPVIAGFAILAALVLLVLGRRRGRGG